MLVKRKTCENHSARVCLSCFKTIQKKNQEDKKGKKQLNFRMFCVEPWRKDGGGRNEPNL